MEMLPVVSTLIESVGYDEADQKLYVKFYSGPTYVYKGVPLELYGELLQSASVGRFFLEKIKGNFEMEKMA